MNDAEVLARLTRIEEQLKAVLDSLRRYEALYERYTTKKGVRLPWSGTR
jgi:hypothetical protein